jgi:hypothetical protein
MEQDAHEKGTVRITDGIQRAKQTRRLSMPKPLNETTKEIRLLRQSVVAAWEESDRRFRAILSHLNRIDPDPGRKPAKRMSKEEVREFVQNY